MSSADIVSNFYFPPSRLAFLNKLQVVLPQNKIIAIEGCSGIGKTTIIEELLTSALPDANKCYVTAARTVNDIQIRSRIIEQLFGNVLFDPEKGLLGSFLEFNQDKQLLIAIDNAHFLSGQIIGELLQLFSELNKTNVNLAIVLAFDKKLSTTLLNITSSFLEIVTVPTLSKQESYQLLVECINDVPAQTNTKVKRWLENASGIPSQLLAFNSDNGLRLEEPKNLNIKMWVSVLIAASLILTIVIYIYRMDVGFSNKALDDLFNQVEQKEQPAAQALANLKTEDSLQNHETAVATKAKITARPAASAEEIYSEIITAKHDKQRTGIDGPNLEPQQSPEKEPFSVATEAISLPEVQPEPVDEGLTEQSNTTIDQETEAQLQVAMNIDETAKRLEKLQAMAGQTNKNDQLAESSVVKQEDKTNPQSEAIESELLSSEPTVQEQKETLAAEPITTEELTVDQQLTTTEPSLSEIVSSTDEATEPSVEPSLYTIDNEAFLALPADHYVLQLTAVSSESTLVKYLLSAPVAIEQMRIYKVKRNNSDWIVVTYGLYASIEEARIDAADVAVTAWAKSVAVIQQEINTFYKQQQN